MWSMETGAWVWLKGKSAEEMQGPLLPTMDFSFQRTGLRQWFEELGMPNKSFTTEYLFLFFSFCLVQFFLLLNSSSRATNWLQSSANLLKEIFYWEYAQTLKHALWWQKHFFHQKWLQNDIENIKMLSIWWLTQSVCNLPHYDVQ